MDIEAAKRIIENPVVQKYIEQMDSDAEDALDEMKANLSEMSDYPSHYLSEYRGDGDALDDAWGEFNGEWNKVVFGKAKDGKAAMAAYRRYVLTLCILEEQNVRFGAYVEADVAHFASVFLLFMIEFTKHLRKRFKELYDDLKELEALLKKAKREVKEAQAQRAINVAITVVGLCIPAVGLGAGIGIAIATITVSTVVDASLGPGKPSVIGTLNTTAGATVGLPKQVKPKWAKFGGAASGLYTLKMDTDEIGDAEKIVKAVQAKMKTIEKTMKTLERFLVGDAAKLAKMQDAFEKALKTAKSEEKKYKSAERQRLALLKQLAKIE